MGVYNKEEISAPWTGTECGRVGLLEAQATQLADF